METLGGTSHTKVMYFAPPLFCKAIFYCMGSFRSGQTGFLGIYEFVGDRPIPMS